MKGYCISVSDSCGSDTPVWPWIVGIVVGIIAVGLITLFVWWLIVYLKVCSS